MKTSRSLPPLLVIVGPTASGKTGLAVLLAKKFSGEVVNADPWQMYQKMAIGVAKPRFLSARRKSSGNKNQRPELVEGPIYYVLNVPHYLFDIATPDKPMTVQRWKKLALRVIAGIHKRKKIPIVVGGTWLYISALVDNLTIPEVPVNQKLRKKIESEIRKSGLEHVYKKILREDPGAADFLDPKNPRRLVRALEVIIATGRPFSQQRKRDKPLFRVLRLGIAVPEKKLENRIAARVRRQIAAGLEKEVRRLAKRYTWKIPPLSAVAYREWRCFFEGRCTKGDVVKAIILHNHQFARKQLRMLRNDSGVRWIQNAQQAEREIQNFLI